MLKYEGKRARIELFMQNYRYVKIAQCNKMTEREYTKEFKVVIFRWYDDRQFSLPFFHLSVVFEIQ